MLQAKLSIFPICKYTTINASHSDACRFRNSAPFSLCVSFMRCAFTVRNSLIMFSSVDAAFMMQSRMSGCRKQFQIFNTVIRRIMISVMNMLIRF